MSDSIKTMDSIAPGPGGNQLLNSLLGTRRESVLSSYLDLWREHGDIARIKVGPLVIHQIVHPDHVRHVLVQNPANYPKGLSHAKLRMALGDGLFTSEGELWRRQRKLMQPTYTPTSVNRFAEIMVDSTQQMLAGWQHLADSGQPLTINQEMLRLTMSIISRSMFNVDIGQTFQEAGDALSYILEFVSESSLSFIDPPLFIPTPSNRRFKRAMQVTDDFLREIIQERRQQPPGDDLLYLLMTAKDAETGQVMDEQQLRDEVLITFFAGHETTALLMTWTWYLLSKHPHVEAKLHDELDRVLQGRAPTMADVPQLLYTRMVLDEVLRLYSPVALMARDPIGDDEIGGYHIPAGSMITLTPFITHRHPQFWDNPEAFQPERMAPELAKQRHRYAYYPFGTGPRICIGSHFALLEATLVLAEMARRYRLQLTAGMAVEPEFIGTLRPNRPVQMTLHRQ